MILFANLLGAFAGILKSVLDIAIILIIVRAGISWFRLDPYHPFVRFLESVTDPMLRPIRRRVPLVGPGLDLSPVVLILIISFLQSFLVTTLAEYAILLKR